MNGTVLEAIIQAVLEIVANHTGPKPLTPADVHAQLLKDLGDGQSAIALEFAAKGWTIPE